MYAMQKKLDVRLDARKLKRNGIRIGVLSLVVLAVLGLSVYSIITKDSFVPLTESLEAREEPVTHEWAPELPVRLVIDAIGVDASIQYVGLNPDQPTEMDVPSNFTDVGWYQPGVRPGMRGSAVMTGHYNGRTVPEAVFYNLSKLQVGDEVVIMSAERVEDIFQVVQVATYAHDASTTEVFSSTDGKKRLNLITCGGEWLADAQVYNERTVVFTELLTDTE